MRWTNEQVETCKVILGRHVSVKDAAKEIGRVLGREVTSDALKHALLANGEQSPRHYLGRAYQSDKPAESPSQGSEGELTKILVCPDVHVPYQDQIAWDTFLRVAQSWKPDVLVILGDFADFYKVSDYAKDPDRVLSFEDEVRLTNRELDRVCALGIPRVVFIEGNHETRLKRYIQKEAVPLNGIVDIKVLFKIAQRGFEWVPYSDHISIGKLHFAHDVGRAGVNCARQSVVDFGGNIIFGHSHRAACHYESTINGERHVGWTLGWLGSPDAIDYKKRSQVLRENQHGFGIAYVENATGLGWVHFVPIIDGKCVVDGQVIKSD